MNEKEFKCNPYFLCSIRYELIDVSGNFQYLFVKELSKRERSSKWKKNYSGNGSLAYRFGHKIKFRKHFST